MSGFTVALKRHFAAVRAMVVFTLLLGVAYPLVVTGIAQAVMKDKADGSLIKDASGKVVGSSLLCQTYVGKDGNALPQYFQTRPSSATNSSDTSIAGCNIAYSGGSNQGTSSSSLKATIRDRVAAYAKAYGVDASRVPQDAVTASGSGLDPDISPENAEIQAASVARARGLAVTDVEALIRDNTADRDLGFLGEKVVNAVTLNAALDAKAPARAAG